MEVFGTFSESVCSRQPWGVYKALAATSASIMHSHNARRNYSIQGGHDRCLSRRGSVHGGRHGHDRHGVRPQIPGSAQAAWPARPAVTPLSGYLSMDSVLVCENVVAPAPVADARGVHARQSPWAKGGERLSSIYFRPRPSWAKVHERLSRTFSFAPFSLSRRTLYTPLQHTYKVPTARHARVAMGGLQVSKIGNPGSGCCTFFALRASVAHP